MRDVDIAALEHACTVISLEDAQEKINEELIDVLFSGKMDGTILQKAKQMDFDPMGDYLAVMIRIDEMDKLIKGTALSAILYNWPTKCFLKIP